MPPDDKRVDEAAGVPADDASSHSGAASQGDDLEALSAKLPSMAPAAAGGDEPAATAGGDEEVDLKALVAPPSQRRSVELAPPPVSNRRVWLLPLLLGLGIGAGAAAIVFMAMPRSADPPAAQAEPVPALEPVPVPAVPASPVAVAPEPAQIPTTVPAVPEAAPPIAAPAPAAPAPPAIPAAGHPRANSDLLASAQANPPASAKPSAPGAQPAAEPPAAAPLPEPMLPGEEEEAEEARKAGRSMDTLLDDALSSTARDQELARRQVAALQPEAVPLTASREEVTRAMTVLLPAIRGCAMGQTGLATAAMVIRNDGKVAGVEVTGAPFAGTASGRCMEGVIRRARLAPFRQTTMRVRFPLAIR